MAFRGRGRGRGGFGAERRGRDVPYQLFPENVELPSLDTILLASNEQVKEMAIKKSRLEQFFQGSCYNLQEDSLRARGNLKKKQKNQEKREALVSYLKLIPSNFPVELIQGSKSVQQTSKKLRWDRKTGDLSLDKFVKLEEKDKDNEGKEIKNEDDEDEEEEIEEEEESSEDDDYNQNIDFDDDEDDMNMEEDGGDEDTYE